MPEPQVPVRLEAVDPDRMIERMIPDRHRGSARRYDQLTVRLTVEPQVLLVLGFVALRVQPDADLDHVAADFLTLRRAADATREEMDVPGDVRVGSHRPADAVGDDLGVLAHRVL